MGDRPKQALRVQFDGKIKLRFHRAKITSDAGLLAFRELDEAFRLTEKGSTPNRRTHGGIGDARLGREASCGRMMIIRVANGDPGTNR